MCGTHETVQKEKGEQCQAKTNRKNSYHVSLLRIWLSSALSLENDPTYAFLISSNLWSMANSLNISTFPYYGTMALFFMSDARIHHVLLIGYDTTKVVSYMHEHHIWIFSFLFWAKFGGMCFMPRSIQYNNGNDSKLYNLPTALCSWGVHKETANERYTGTKAKFSSVQFTSKWYLYAQ